MTAEELESMFTAPSGMSEEVLAKHQAVNSAGLVFAQVLAEKVPAESMKVCAEKVRDAVLTSISAIQS